MRLADTLQSELSGFAGRLNSLADLVPWKALTLLGVVLYGLLRIDYFLFYGSFGVAPEEVGFGYFEILSQSVIAILIAVAWHVVFLGVLLLNLDQVRTLFLWVRTSARTISHRTKDTRQRLGVVWALIYLAWLPWWLVFTVLGAFSTGVLRWVLLGLGGAAWLGFFHLVQLGPEKQVSEPPMAPTPPANAASRPRMSSVVSGALSQNSLLMVILIVLLVIFPYRALDDAGRVQAGKSIAHAWPSGFPYPAWGAVRAFVSWIGHTPEPLKSFEGHCLMYLGQANGIVVLYDVDARQTFRIPSAAVIISTTPRPGWWVSGKPKTDNRCD